MSNYFMDTIHIARDGKVKTPIAIHSSLPDSRRFIIFLCAERRMPQVLEQEGEFSIESLPNFGRCSVITSTKMITERNTHLRERDFFFPVLSEHAMRAPQPWLK